jgi:hypothetical protein
MKLFIMMQSLSLCQIGYAWFGQASSRSLSMWSVGGHTGHLSLRMTVEMRIVPKPPISQPWPLSRRVKVVVP